MQIKIENELVTSLKLEVTVSTFSQYTKLEQIKTKQRKGRSAGGEISTHCTHCACQQCKKCKCVFFSCNLVLKFGSSSMLTGINSRIIYA